MDQPATWTIGDVTVTAVVELDTAVPFVFLLPSASPEVVAAEPWLAPHWIVDVDTMRLRMQALVIHSQGQVIVVDTCIGNHKPRPGFELFDQLDTTFLDDLGNAGVHPSTVDVVTCTHLHIDHVGWNTRLVDGEWVPTFPEARYLFSQIEFHHWRTEANGDHMHAAPFRDSVQPVFDAGLAQLVDVPHTITDEVQLVPTTGHTPGHASVRIDSAGARAYITGDMAHHPIQLARPELASSADTDQAESTGTRRRFVDDVVDTDALIIGTHFGAPSGGRLRRDGSGVRFVPVD